MPETRPTSPVGATLAFDIYGTLIDTHGLVERLAASVGQRAAEFSRLWRDKQLEYTFRRGLMDAYQPFPRCTRDALDYACAAFGANIAASERDALMAAYRELPAFPGAAAALDACRAAGHRPYAFSNGLATDVRALLAAAGLADRFVDVISVDEIGSFKPAPAVYAHFLARSGAAAADTWLVSGNPFDVLGARRCGWHSAWLQRTGAPFDPWQDDDWPAAPSVVLDALDQLPAALCGAGEARAQI